MLRAVYYRSLHTEALLKVRGRVAAGKGRKAHGLLGGAGGLFLLLEVERCVSYTGTDT